MFQHRDRAPSRPLLTLALALSLAVPAFASAQDGGGSETGITSSQGRQGRHGRRAHRGQRRGQHRSERMNRRIAHMQESLNLTAAQETQIRQILEQAHGRRDAAAGQGRSQVRAQIRQVLNPGQRAQARQQMSQRHDRRVARRVSRLADRLSLTDPQRDQVRGILQVAQGERRSLWQGELGPDARQQAMRAIGSRTHQALNAILTPTQQEQLSAMRAERNNRVGHRGRGRGHRGHGRHGRRHGQGQGRGPGQAQGQGGRI